MWSILSRSGKWRTIRKKYLEHNNYCRCCGRNSQLQVHHIVPVSVDSSKELDESNLITLCSTYCHFVFGHFMSWNSWNPNVVEDCEAYLEKVKNKPVKIKALFYNSIFRKI
jgi:hypothetical protein